MARKIFVSYKHSDSDVQELASSGFFPTTARTYVNELEQYFYDTHIYKGEREEENLSGFKDSYIESQLRDQIFDSSITIVLISKNMFDRSMNENDQWIPWEISYSLRETTRNGRTSGTNAMLAVVLPDANGNYDYFVESVGCVHCSSIRYKTTELFRVLGENMFNRKSSNTIQCPNGVCGMLHTGNDHSYVHPVIWREFIDDIEGYLSHAARISDNMDDYRIIKNT